MVNRTVERCNCTVIVLEYLGLLNKLTVMLLLFDTSAMEVMFLNLDCPRIKGQRDYELKWLINTWGKS